MENPPKVRMMVIDGSESRNGSWLNLADLRAYMEWLKPQFPEDANTLEKLDIAILQGVVHGDTK